MQARKNVGPLMSVWKKQKAEPVTGPRRRDTLGERGRKRESDNNLESSLRCMVERLVLEFARIGLSQRQAAWPLTRL
jgi:hypothetical protein